MQNAFEASLFKLSIHAMGISQVYRNELAALQCPSMASAQVVEDSDVMPRRQQRSHRV